MKEIIRKLQQRVDSLKASVAFCANEARVSLKSGDAIGYVIFRRKGTADAIRLHEKHRELQKMQHIAALMQQMNRFVHN